MSATVRRFPGREEITLWLDGEEEPRLLPTPADPGEEDDALRIPGADLRLIKKVMWNRLSHESKVETVLLLFKIYLLLPNSLEEHPEYSKERGLLGALSYALQLLIDTALQKDTPYGVSGGALINAQRLVIDDATGERPLSRDLDSAEYQRLKRARRLLKKARGMVEARLDRSPRRRPKRDK